MWTAMDSVQFEAGRADIQPRCAEKIAKLAAWMAIDRNVVISLDGHQDDAVVNDNDPTLGARRVQAVRDALIAAGVDPKRIVVGEFGVRPISCRGPVENCLALGRRVDVHAARF
jgi:peptidoglycan-associated lipoprotein